MERISYTNKHGFTVNGKSRFSLDGYAATLADELQAGTQITRGSDNDAPEKTETEKLEELVFANADLLIEIDLERAQRELGLLSESEGGEVNV